MTRRRGFTLIELMAVVTTTAIVMAVSAVLVHSLLRIDRDSRARAVEDMALAKMARAFRADVREAVGVKEDEAPEGSPSPLTLALPDGRSVAYRMGKGGLVRTRKAGDEAAGTETYRLPRRSSVRWHIEPEGEPRAVGLVLLRRDGEGREGPSEFLRIEAMLGRDHRFEAGAPGDEASDADEGADTP
jgi:type II secretory pathway pseudopilin PulG